jgi:hypothetical protein
MIGLVHGVDARDHETPDRANRAEDARRTEDFLCEFFHKFISSLLIGHLGGAGIEFAIEPPNQDANRQDGDDPHGQEILPGVLVGAPLIVIHHRSEHVPDQDREAHAFGIGAEETDEDDADRHDHAVDDAARPGDRHRDRIGDHIGAAEENAAREHVRQEIGAEIHARIADRVDRAAIKRQDNEGPEERRNDPPIGDVADEKIGQADENRDLADLAHRARGLP